MVGVWAGSDLMDWVLPGNVCDSQGAYRYSSHVARDEDPMALDDHVSVRLPLSQLCGNISKANAIQAANEHGVFLLPTFSVKDITR